MGNIKPMRFFCSSLKSQNFKFEIIFAFSCFLYADNFAIYRRMGNAFLPMRLTLTPKNFSMLFIFTFYFSLQSNICPSVFPLLFLRDLCVLRDESALGNSYGLVSIRGSIL